MPRILLSLALIVLVGSVYAFDPVVGTAFAEPASLPSNGNYIVKGDGTPMFLLAANYEGAPDRSWKMWQDGLFDLGLIEQDFIKAKHSGISVLRIFIQNPLPAEIKAGNWAKLDGVVALARKHGLLLIVTFYDYSEPDLNKVAEIDRLVAQRYANEGAILAYDLRNEPHFQDLATAIYPSGINVPLQGDSLIKRYGERVSQEAVNAWRLTDEGKTLVPARFSPVQAYYYANNYRIYREFLADAGSWVAARNYTVSVVDYIDSPDAAKWQPLLEALSGTLSAWIAAQLNAIRAGDSKHPVTVGYSDVTLAKLGANSVLNFHSVHRYQGGSLKELHLLFGILQNLRRTFVSQPLLLEEFGYANDAMAPEVSSIYETSVLLNLWKEGLAGGVKWMLNDLSSGWDARQMSFGIYRADGSPKPVALALRALADYMQNAVSIGGSLSVSSDAAAGIRYVYSAADALFVSGKSFADQRLKVQADAPTQVFISWSDPSKIRVLSTANAQLQVNPAALLGDPALPRRFSVTRLDQGSEANHPFSVDANYVAFAAEKGQAYYLKLSRSSADAMIQVVWPHGGKPVSQATKANIGVNLFEHGTPREICAEWTPSVRLWQALNNGVEQEVGTGAVAVRNVNGRSYRVWEFNNVDVSAANDPVNKYYFRVSIDGLAASYSNIWSHGADARTYFPKQDVPSGVSAAPPSAVDAKIEIVWPHDNLPVDKATKANIAAMLFEQGTAQSVARDWNPTVRLWRGLNNQPLEMVAFGQKEMRTVGALTFPIWTFNNVDVSAATNPSNKYYFRVTVDGVPSRSNVWSHGVDARTYYPEPRMPEPSDGC